MAEGAEMSELNEFLDFESHSNWSSKDWARSTMKSTFSRCLFLAVCFWLLVFGRLPGPLFYFIPYIQQCKTLSVQDLLISIGKIEVKPDLLRPIA